MGNLEASMIHHVGIVLIVLWALSFLNYSHPFAYVFSLIYLYLVHERYITRLKRKLQFEERKQANQRRVLSDSETVRWLNHAVEKIWPICMENITSQKILLPIIPWFLEKYKPWTAKRAEVQQLYLGRNPPMFTEIRVLRESSDDDHLVLELGMNFLSAEDMSALLAVKLRKRLGFGMWTKLHVTGMHIEGKVLIGVKFLRKWPFLGRLRVCFAEPPYFQMIVKPIFTHGLDVAELPGIAGWMDKLLSIAFEQTLVEPNMLVVDVEKFVSQQSEDWFSVDEKEPVAYAKVEVVEAYDIKPSDLNGLADPYVKGQMGPYRFRTKTQKKTLFPNWQEEFRIPICTWESPNMLAIEVRNKDHFVDDTLGECSINISELRGCQRHDMWLPLCKVKTGRLRLAITVLNDFEEGDDKLCDEETLNEAEKRNSFASEVALRSSVSSVSSEKSTNMTDHYEPIDIEGKQETEIWIHQPGIEVTQTWEPRKGKSRRLDTQIHREPNGSSGNTSSPAYGPLTNENSNTGDNAEGKLSLDSLRKGLQKIGSVFHRSSKEYSSGSIGEALPSPRPNLRALNEKDTGVKFVVLDSLSVPASGKVNREESKPSSGGNDSESPGKGNVKNVAKSIIKHASKSARSIKDTLSRKGSRGSRGNSSVTAGDISVESDSSYDESLSSPKNEVMPAITNPTWGNNSNN